MEARSPSYPAAQCTQWTGRPKSMAWCLLCAIGAAIPRNLTPRLAFPPTTPRHTACSGGPTAGNNFRAVAFFLAMFFLFGVSRRTLGIESGTLVPFTFPCHEMKFGTLLVEPKLAWARLPGTQLISACLCFWV